MVYRFHTFGLWLQYGYPYRLGGIQTDVKIPADQALLTDQIMTILAAIKRNSNDTGRITGLEKIIEQLRQQLDALKKN